ncbi:MAG: nucleoside hydrolase [Acidobacteriota bacterium]|nr:nucleoside hydrolase [Acidobacteriota bacterium]
MSRHKSLSAILSLFYAVFIFACCCLTVVAQSRRAVVLTTDVGAEMDDQWTLAHLALAPEIELRGVVTTHAPSLAAPAAETAARVAREVLKHLPVRRPPPILPGSSVPLARGGVARKNPGVEFIIRESRGFSPGHRLAVLVIGAATDTASALMLDPTLGERIEVIAMGFDDRTEGGDSWNVKNDPQAWRVLLASSAPITIGDAMVTKRELSMTPPTRCRIVRPTR